MALKLMDGNYVTGPGGLPMEATDREELLQDAVLRLTVRRGSFPYGRELGSGLYALDKTAEHSRDRAVALANEALLDLPGVRAAGADFPPEGGIALKLNMPWGEETVKLGEL